MEKNLNTLYEIQSESSFVMEEVLAEYNLRILVYKFSEKVYYTVRLNHNEIDIKKSASLEEAYSIAEEIKYQFKMV